MAGARAGTLGWFIELVRFYGWDDALEVLERRAAASPEGEATPVATSQNAMIAALLRAQIKAKIDRGEFRWVVEPPEELEQEEQKQMDGDHFHRDIRPLFEEMRAEFIAKARAVAERLGRDGRAISVDDVRAVCPPPEGIDGRVMGAIFRAKEWEKVGYDNSVRSTCHFRPVARFRLRRA